MYGSPCPGVCWRSSSRPTTSPVPAQGTLPTPTAILTRIIPSPPPGLPRSPQAVSPHLHLHPSLGPRTPGSGQRVMRDRRNCVGVGVRLAGAYPSRGPAYMLTCGYPSPTAPAGPTMHQLRLRDGAAASHYLHSTTLGDPKASPHQGLGDGTTSPHHPGQTDCLQCQVLAP